MGKIELTNVNKVFGDKMAATLPLPDLLVQERVPS